jgi:hypothetical protein
VVLLDGRPLQAEGVVAVGDRVGLLDSSHLAYIGTLAGSGSGPEPTPPPQSGPSETPSPATAPSPVTIDAGGWRWHQLTVRPYGTVVPVAHGYLAYCGKSMCTSPDGWTWSAPPDPSIFKADQAALFTPTWYGHASNGSYVVLAGEGAWYSLDGINWKVAATPEAPFGFANLGVGPQGYSLSVLTDQGLVGPCTSYASVDGATWASGGLVPCLIASPLGGDMSVSGGVLGQGAGIKTNGPMRYSSDGRTWSNASVPGATIDAVHPFRLRDGTLVVSTYTGLLLRSRDGLAWNEMPGWPAVGSTSQVLTLAVVGDRILVAAMDDQHVWESTDDGATFHRILDSVNDVQAWGGLATVENGNTYYVGEPLDTAEPGTTPTATGLPDLNPHMTPQPEPSAPSGGISKAEAIRIATAAAHPSSTVAATARASASFDTMLNRWTWMVGFSTSDDQGISVTIDFYTGEVLRVGHWIT